MKRTPLRSCRPTPRRRAPERVQHERIKPKEAAPPTKEEAAHMARVAKKPCLVGRDCRGRTTVHHVTSDGLKRIARSHRRVVNLCERHHLIQHGPHESVEALGHGGFEAVYRINLLAESDRLWEHRNDDPDL